MKGGRSMGKQNHCNNCNSSELMRLHIYGAMITRKIEGQSKEPDVQLDILACTACGSMQIDINSVKIKDPYDLWTGMKLKEEC